MQSDIADICTRMEENNPPIKTVSIIYIISSVQSQHILMTMEGFDDSFRTYNRLIATDHNAWRLFGQAIARNISLQVFAIYRRDTSDGEMLAPEAAECLRVLYDELKHNASIETLRLQIFPANEVPMFHLDFFVQNDRNVTSITLMSTSGVTYEQSDMILSALADTHSMKNFDVMRCSFGDEAFIQIISNCVRIKGIQVGCDGIIQYTALAALLRSQTTILSEIQVYLQGAADEGLSLISASLLRNEKLKVLKLYHRRDVVVDLDTLGTLLCNSASIDDIISNSNHTIEDISLPNDNELPPIIRDLLLLNKDTNKHQVIRNKILRYYLIGDFDVSPFANMHLSLLLKVICLIDGDFNYRHNATFRLLRGIHELSDVNSRD
eukprot:scaffold17152_cov75-Cyclotella_meneghiniana.AAC.4